MNLSTDGLIIKVNNVGEYDRAVSVLTASQGIVRAFVHGARSLKNKNGAGTSLLAFSHLTFGKKKDTYTILEASTEKVFLNLRGDIEKLTLAQHFCELALVLAPEQEDATEYLRLMLNSLNFLSEGTRHPTLLKAITELRMLVLSGYTPDLVACRDCAKFSDDALYFDPINGEFYCSECVSGGAQYVSFGSGTLAALRHIVYSPFDNLYNFSIPEETIKLLAEAVEKFLLSQVEHKFSALQFYKTL